MAGKKGMKTYPLEVRILAVKMFFEEGITKREILDKLGVQNDTQLEEWFRAYKKEGYDGLKPKSKGRPRKALKDPIPQSLEERVKQLEMENELLRSFLSETGRWLINQSNID